MTATATVHHLPQGGDDTGIVDGVQPLIPPGTYRLAYRGHYTFHFQRQPKVALQFSITDFGEHFEKVIVRFYNVSRLIGKPGKSGRFAVRQGCDLRYELALVIPDQMDRLDRLPLRHLKSLEIMGRVHTVSKNRNQRDIPEVIRYSVIKEILGPAPA